MWTWYIPHCVQNAPSPPRVCVPTTRLHGGHTCFHSTFSGGTLHENQNFITDAALLITRIGYFLLNKLGVGKNICCFLLLRS